MLILSPSIACVILLTLLSEVGPDDLRHRDQGHIKVPLHFFKQLLRKFDVAPGRKLRTINSSAGRLLTASNVESQKRSDDFAFVPMSIILFTSQVIKRGGLVNIRLREVFGGIFA